MNKQYQKEYNEKNKARRKILRDSKGAERAQQAALFQKNNSSKLCSKCKQDLSFDHYIQDDTKTGFRAQCNDCRLTAKAVYRENNRESIREYDSRPEVLERQKERNKIKYNTNEEYRQNEIERRCKFNKENRAKITDYEREKYQNDPDFKASRQARNARRRAQRVEVNETFTGEQRKLTFQVFGNKCANCGSTENLAIDHFEPLSKGNPLTPLNACVLCQSCNSSKSVKPPEHFFDIEKYWEIKVLMDKTNDFQET